MVIFTDFRLDFGFTYLSGPRQLQICLKNAKIPLMLCRPLPIDMNGRILALSQKFSGHEKIEKMVFMACEC
jgi:hypothetical protein